MHRSVRGDRALGSRAERRLFAHETRAGVITESDVEPERRRAPCRLCVVLRVPMPASARAQIGRFRGSTGGCAQWGRQDDFAGVAGNCRGGRWDWRRRRLPRMPADGCCSPVVIGEPAVAEFTGGPGHNRSRDLARNFQTCASPRRPEADPRRPEASGGNRPSRQEPGAATVAIGFRFAGTWTAQTTPSRPGSPPSIDPAVAPMDSGAVGDGPADTHSTGATRSMAPHNGSAEPHVRRAGS
jgi:hypothetical protein